MQRMFYVRFMLQHISPGATPPRATTTHATRKPSRPPPPVERFLPHSFMAACKRIQPAARIQYLERDRYVIYVPSALHATTRTSPV